MTSLLVCSISSISVHTAEIDEPYTDIVEVQSEGLLTSYSLLVSDYNGSLCVNASTFSPAKREEIGVKDLIVEYSYNGKD